MRAFQCLAVDLFEYKSLSQGNRSFFSVIDYLTRFVVLIPIKDKAACMVVRRLIERVFSVFGPPETLYSDQGKEFENKFGQGITVRFWI